MKKKIIDFLKITFLIVSAYYAIQALAYLVNFLLLLLIIGIYLLAL